MSQLNSDCKKIATKLLWSRLQKGKNEERLWESFHIDLSDWNDCKDEPSLMQVVGAILQFDIGDRDIVCVLDETHSSYLNCETEEMVANFIEAICYFFETKDVRKDDIVDYLILTGFGL